MVIGENAVPVSGLVLVGEKLDMAAGVANIGLSKITV